MPAERTGLISILLAVTGVLATPTSQAHTSLPTKSGACATDLDSGLVGFKSFNTIATFSSTLELPKPAAFLPSHQHMFASSR